METSKYQLNTDITAANTLVSIFIGNFLFFLLGLVIVTWTNLPIQRPGVHVLGTWSMQ